MRVSSLFQFKINTGREWCEDCVYGRLANELFPNKCIYVSETRTGRPDQDTAGYCRRQMQSLLIILLSKVCEHRILLRNSISAWPKAPSHCRKNSMLSNKAQRGHCLRWSFKIETSLYYCFYSQIQQTFVIIFT